MDSGSGYIWCCCCVLTVDLVLSASIARSSFAGYIPSEPSNSTELRGIGSDYLQRDVKLYMTILSYYVMHVGDEFSFLSWIVSADRLVLQC